MTDQPFKHFLEALHEIKSHPSDDIVESIELICQPEFNCNFNQCWQVYDAWQSDPTVTYLQTAGGPLTDIDFPSITICGQGSISEVYDTLIG